MSRPRLLDLFAGAQGAGVGYAWAGFEVHAVDIEPHDQHPAIASFTVADALDVLADVPSIRSFDAVHASPPCKSENPMRHLADKEHPDLLTPTLAALRAIPGLAWVVENVASTGKLPGALQLCGASFGLGATCRDGVWRHLRRHRRFESSVPLMGPGCACPGGQPVGVYGTGGGGQQTRGYKGRPEESRAAMGIDWMSQDDLSQAIPPAYTQFIGEQLAAHLAEVAA